MPLLFGVIWIGILASPAFITATAVATAAASVGDKCHHAVSIGISILIVAPTRGCGVRIVCVVVVLFFLLFLFHGIYSDKDK